MGIFGSRSRKKATKAKTPARQSTPRPRKFDAVQIQPGGDVCQAAQDAARTRHLCDKAPLLPLNDCDRPDRCTCRYAHFSDRRSSPRRKSEGALPTHSHETPTQERRGDQGRRAEELDESGLRRSWFKNV